MNGTQLHMIAGLQLTYDKRPSHTACSMVRSITHLQMKAAPARCPFKEPCKVYATLAHYLCAAAISDKGAHGGRFAAGQG